MQASRAVGESDSAELTSGIPCRDAFGGIEPSGQGPVHRRETIPPPPVGPRLPCQEERIVANPIHVTIPNSPPFISFWGVWEAGAFLTAASTSEDRSAHERVTSPLSLSSVGSPWPMSAVTGPDCGSLSLPDLFVRPRDTQALLSQEQPPMSQLCPTTANCHMTSLILRMCEQLHATPLGCGAM